jgi:hypothetical protein
MKTARLLVALLLFLLFIDTGAQAQKPSSEFFESARPRLIILVHGATDDPRYHPEKHIGTLQHARDYWEYALVQNLLGATSDLSTMSGVQLNSETWTEARVRDSELLDQFIIPDSALKAVKTSRRLPELSVLLTYRNGSETLASQGRAIIRQVYAQYTQLAQVSEVQPQIIWVGHSMGGNVIRYVLSNPIEALNNIRLTAAERTQADFLRDRTLFAVTLGTPHEGSPLADKFTQIAQFLGQNPSPLREFYTLAGMNSPREHVIGWLGADSDSTRHLRTDFWANQNISALAPERACRTDESLIPIYCLGSRSPGRTFFDDPNRDPVTLAGAVGRQDNKTLYETIGLMSLDYALHTTPGTPNHWGIVPPASRDLDWVRRAFLTLLPPGELSSPREQPELFPLYYLKVPWRSEPRSLFDLLPTFVPSGANRPNTDNSYSTRAADGEIDNDGMVGIDSALGVKLGTTTLEYFDHNREWPIAGNLVRGSWYRLYSGPWNWDDHGSLRRNPETARWLRQHLFRSAGPWVGGNPISQWDPEQLGSLE